MMVLSWEVVETFEGGTWLEEISHWRQVLETQFPWLPHVSLVASWPA